MLPHRKRKEHNPGAKPRTELEVRVIEGSVEEAPPRLEAEVLPEAGIRIGTGAGKSKPDLLSFERPRDVHRLEAEAEPQGPVQARSMSELEPAAPQLADSCPKQRNLATWTLWMAVGTVVLAVLAVMAMSPNDDAAEEPVNIIATEQFLGEEKTYLLENGPRLTREAEAILKKYSEAKSPAEVLPLVRDASRVKDRLTLLWKPMGPLSSSQPVETRFTDNDSVRPALLLRGETADHSRYEMTFIREDGQLKLDWEASMGIGDVQLAELRKSRSVVKDAKVRVTVKSESFYTSDFPESDYRSYQLSDADREEFVWAFVRRSSPTGERLAREFNESSMVLEEVSEFPATLRISGPQAEGVHLFEITDLLHKGWVSP